MAEKRPESIIKVERKLVEQSCGLAMDLGGSVTKIIYRSKEDYSGGQLKSVSDESSGSLRSVMFSREELDSALSFILENCDLTEDEDGIRHIPCAGLGGNLYKDDIETRLNAKVHNLPEFICFRKAVMAMVKTQPPEEAFMKHTAKELDMARKNIEIFNMFASMDGLGGTIDIESITDDDLMGRDDSQADFPCFIVMCGSAFVILKLYENGHQELAEVSLISGRFFLGSSAVMTGVTDYKKLAYMINTSDGKTADLYTQDMTKSVEQDAYSHLSQQDHLMFHFGKCNAKPRDQIKDGDLIHSLATVMSENLGQIVHLTSAKHNVRRAYFCGSFISEEPIRNQIIRTIYFRNARAPKGSRLQVEFLNHGASLGALGAFISHYEKN